MSIIGVTIAINPTYQALATISANCLKEMTGLDVIILTEYDLIKYDLIYPASLKLKLFELVDSENILYFDADWFCLNKWNPNIYVNNKSIIACHDFVLNIDWPLQYINLPDIYFENNLLIKTNQSIENIRTEYITEINSFTGIKTNHRKWINTGFYIINRTNHESWLKKSFKYYTSTVGHHFQYYEQPSMNLGLSMSNYDVYYLPRKFNTLIASKRKWPSNIIGYHVKIKNHPEFLTKLLINKIQSVADVIKYFTNE